MITVDAVTTTAIITPAPAKYATRTVKGARAVRTTIFIHARRNPAAAHGRGIHVTHWNDFLTWVTGCARRFDPHLEHKVPPNPTLTRMVEVTTIVSIGPSGAKKSARLSTVTQLDAVNLPSN